jgi:hypothetical protein
MRCRAAGSEGAADLSRKRAFTPTTGTPGFNISANFCDVPINKADASVTRIVPDGLGLARAMNADANLVRAISILLLAWQVA